MTLLRDLFNALTYRTEHSNPDPANPGAGLLIAEGGAPRRVKPAYLTDDDCARIAAYARARRTGGSS